MTHPLPDLRIDDENRPPFAAFVSDADTGESVFSIVSKRGYGRETVQEGGIAAAISALSSGQIPPLFLVIDVSNSPEPLADIDRLAALCPEGTVVLALGDVNDVSLYRALIQAGIQDYLIKPLSRAPLEAAIIGCETALAQQQSEARSAAASSEERARSILVLGARGGVGSSTLAANLAWWRADAAPTTLLDLDMCFGTSALSFDLEPGRGLIDALISPDRIDDVFLDRAAIKPGRQLSLLAAEASIGNTELLQSDPQPAEMIEALKCATGTLIIDMPRHYLIKNPDILAKVDDIILVSDQSLAGARDCMRIMAAVRAENPDAAVRLVLVSDEAGAGKPEVEAADFATSVELSIATTLIRDTKAVRRAAEQERPLIEAVPTCQPSQAIAALAAALFPERGTGNPAVPSTGKGWLHRLLQANRTDMPT